MGQHKIVSTKLQKILFFRQFKDITQEDNIETRQMTLFCLPTFYALL